MRKYPKMMLAGLALISGLLFFPSGLRCRAGLTDSGYVAAGPGVVQEDEDTTSECLLAHLPLRATVTADSCSGGHNLTYSGTVPKANHTISADLNLFPIGTQLLINGTVYTVEDMGSSVNGKKIDIYYDSHEEALAAGTYTAEVFDGTNI